MRVYLAAAMTNPARDLPVIAAILAHLEARGHEVPSRHVADPAGRAADASLSDHELAQRDLDWIAGCDVLIAEVSAPSHGVGVEVMAARQRGLPVLLLHRRDVVVSRLLLGLPGVSVGTYRDVGEACAAVDAFVNESARGRAPATPTGA